MTTEAIRAFPLAAMTVASSLLLAGCASPLPPFVQKVHEVKSKDRAEPPVTMVEVCYNRTTTTPEAVRKLAEDACVKKGGHAVFVRHRSLQCPLLQPAGANFVCR